MGGSLKIENKNKKFYWIWTFQNGQIEKSFDGFTTSADAQRDFLRKSKYFNVPKSVNGNKKDKDFYLIRKESGDIDLETFEDYKDAVNEIKLYEKGDKRINEYTANDYYIVRVKKPKYYSPKSIIGNKMAKKKIIKKSAPKKAVKKKIIKKSAPKKTVTKKIVKKSAPKKTVTKKIVKKSAPKKAVKKLTVNLGIGSIKQNVLSDYKNTLQAIANHEKFLISLKNLSKKDEFKKSKENSKTLKESISITNRLIKEKKTHLRELKKLI